MTQLNFIVKKIVPWAAEFKKMYQLAMIDLAILSNRYNNKHCLF